LAVTAGDFDNNGVADLAVGAPFENVGTLDSAGAVTVLDGSASGATDVPARGSEPVADCMAPDAVAAHYGYLGLQLTAKPPQELEPLKLCRRQRAGRARKPVRRLVRRQSRDHPDQSALAEPPGGGDPAGSSWARWSSPS
jgi:hypothetical protein